MKSYALKLPNYFWLWRKRWRYMRRLLLLLLVIAIALPSLATLTSCGADNVPTNDGEDNLPPTEDGGKVELLSPEYKDYGRGTVDFDKIEYTRPNLDYLTNDTLALAENIRGSLKEYDELISEANAISKRLDTFRTMLAYAMIMVRCDAADVYWQEEYSYLTEAAPTLSNAVEELCVAAAQSENAEKYEADCFGEGLILEYGEGGKYTDTLVTLFLAESTLENEYTLLSTSTVVINYKSKKGTLDEILAYYQELYGKDSKNYATTEKEAYALYYATRARLSREITVELFKTRRLIADELGYATYLDYAYETAYHDYTREELYKYLTSVATYAVPVYMKLYHHVFLQYFRSCKSDGELTEAELLNNTYGAMCSLNPELAEAYSYMLQHGLYDVAGYEDNRYRGAFCTYLDDYNAPFLFVSTSGSCEDYGSLSHEFGHFYDSYTNDNSGASLDLLEVSSQGLELLTMIELDGKISDEEMKHLTYSEINSAMRAIIIQGFYALFEHYAYSLEYETVSEASLRYCMERAALDMGFDTEEELTVLFGTKELNSLGYVIIPHIVLMPSYVQSYATSATAALEIYTMELEEDGTGLDAYLALVDRSNEDMSFVRHLLSAGLNSPFDERALKEIMNSVYYSIRGENYFIKPNDQLSA